LSPVRRLVRSMVPRGLGQIVKGFVEGKVIIPGGHASHEEGIINCLSKKHHYARDSAEGATTSVSAYFKQA